LTKVLPKHILVAKNDSPINDVHQNTDTKGLVLSELSHVTRKVFSPRKVLFTNLLCRPYQDRHRNKSD